MDDRGGQDDDLVWPRPRSQGQPDPQPDGRGEAGRIDRGGAAVTAGLFGALAGITLPPLVFWVAFSILTWIGLPDTLTALIALALAFGLPLSLFRRVLGLLGRSSPRYDGARTALTIAASVAVGMWLLVATMGTLVIVVLRSMG